MSRSSTASIIVVVATTLSLMIGCGGEDRAPVPVTNGRTAALEEAGALLRSVQGTSMAPGWASAALSDQVTPIYRPDVDGPAYYEVQVRPAGYIVVSTGKHDHPISQWSSTGLAPTQQLVAKAAQKGKTAARFYRLDALSYAGEDHRGELVVRLGELPSQLDLSGVDPSRMNDVYESVWSPQVDANNKVIGGEIVTRVRRSSGQAEVVGLERYGAGQFSTVKAFAPNIKVRSASSWTELKASYGKRFSRQLLKLADQAARAWRLKADSAGHQQSDVDEDDIARKAMALHPITGWNVITAEGGDPAQRNYHQIAPFTQPNFNSCYSGCGATAWAMMFGWADTLAANHSPTWSNHKGIYRANGGYGTDVEAPLVQDAGIEAMTMELRARLGTICLTNQGMTLHSNMHLAAYYLVGRDYSGIRTAYNFLTMPDSNLLQAAMNIINTNRAVIVGVGAGTGLHYALAYGYGYRYMSDGSVEIILNVNWGNSYGANDAWIPGSTWFVGELVP